MSRERRHLPSQRVEAVDDATLKGNATLTGLVRTSRGYATAVAVFAPDGSVVSLKLGLSQAHKPFAAIEHKKAVIKAAMAS